MNSVRFFKDPSLRINAKQNIYYAYLKVPWHPGFDTHRIIEIDKNTRKVFYIKYTVGYLKFLMFVLEGTTTFDCLFTRGIELRSACLTYGRALQIKSAFFLENWKRPTLAISERRLPLDFAPLGIFHKLWNNQKMN